LALIVNGAPKIGCSNNDEKYSAASKLIWKTVYYFDLFLIPVDTKDPSRTGGRDRRQERTSVEQDALDLDFERSRHQMGAHRWH
jgi:hypothetical protein